MDNEDMLNIDDAAKFLEISKPTLYRLIGQDVIKGVKIGQRWRFRKADLTAYLQRSPASVPAAPEEVLDAELAYFAQRLSATGGKLPPLEGAVAVVDETRAPSDIAERKTFQLTGAILALAIAQWASDVHLEPTRADGEICLKVRFRIDGVMHEVRSLPAALRDPVTARFKLMAEMNVAEKRIPQDGRIPIKSGDGDSYDLRVSTVSTISGAESVVMRLLSPSRVILGLDNMGLSAADRAAVDALLARPSGLILCSGPTGSGKTTLLYSFLTQLNKPTCKLMSIEDPVEFLLPGVTQIPVNERIGVTFAAALRSVMRQDPDIILATEIRDAEMAKLLMEAALTGHLVLGTLHTQDAVDGLQRLRDLGIEPFYVSGALAGITGQRLCRKLCPHCRVPMESGADDPVRRRFLNLAMAGGWNASASNVTKAPSKTSGSSTPIDLLGRSGRFLMSIMEVNKNNIGEFLVEKRLITEDQLRQAKEVRRSAPGDIAKIVIDLGFAWEHDVTAARAEMVDDEPIVRIVHTIVLEAIRVHASAITIEPGARGVVVKYEIDGKTDEAMALPKHLNEAIATRFKMLAEMDIHETKSTQQGRIPIRHEGAEYDLWVDTEPTEDGEKTSIRFVLRRDPSAPVFYQAVGCDKCQGKGYRGRIAIYEVLTMNEKLAAAYAEGASTSQMRELALATGMKTLLVDGVQKAAEGLTTLDEVARVIGAGDL